MSPGPARGHLPWHRSGAQPQPRVVVIPPLLGGSSGSGERGKRVEWMGKLMAGTELGLTGPAGVDETLALDCWWGARPIWCRNPPRLSVWG